MRLALAQARLAAERGEVPVGAVLVRRGAAGEEARVVACAHNAPIGLRDPTAHAEMQVLREGAHAIDNYRLDDCEVYVTLEPCAMCAQAMLHARIRRVVYGAPEPKTGAAGSVVDLFSLPQLNHQTAVVGGVLEEECAGLMREFFEERRRQARLHADPLREDALRAPAQVFKEVWAHWPSLSQASRTVSDLPGFEGLRFHYLDVGQGGDGPVLLALHSPDAWWPQWAGFAIDGAAKGARVLVPDLIGFGQSDKPKKPGWHSLERHARGLAVWLRRLGVSQLRLAVAPGQARLAQALTEAWGPGVSVEESACPVADAVPPGWKDVPYPDAGHRSAQRAWRAHGWDQGA
ncbi:hypothetical protein GCM10027292_18590 [Hydrogenophaga aquatica]